MTATEAPAEETPAEEPERSSRAAGGCVLAVAAGAAGAVVYAVPELGYFVAGLTITTTVSRTRAWIARRAEPADEEQEPVDIVAALHGLSPDGEHVRLTQLAEAAELPDTKAVRALLDEAGIPIRTGVRAGGKNGPGVHATDIPPIEATPSDGCLCSSTANTNANNDGGEGPEKGFRVERTGQAGVTVYDLAETRHYAAKT